MKSTTYSEFNLARALEGEPVFTHSGKQVTNIKLVEKTSGQNYQCVNYKIEGYVGTKKYEWDLEGHRLIGPSDPDDIHVLYMGCEAKAEPADYLEWKKEQATISCDADKKLIPFDLQRALAGDAVITRAGDAVKIAGYNPDANDNNQILGWLDNKSYCWLASGKIPFGEKEEHNHDLFMAPKQREVWVNLYKYRLGGPGHFATVHASEDAANDPFDNVDQRLMQNLSDRLSGKAHKIIIEE